MGSARLAPISHRRAPAQPPPSPAPPASPNTQHGDLSLHSRKEMEPLIWGGEKALFLAFETAPCAASVPAPAPGAGGGAGESPARELRAAEPQSLELFCFLEWVTGKEHVKLVCQPHDLAYLLSCSRCLIVAERVPGSFPGSQIPACPSGSQAKTKARLSPPGETLRLLRSSHGPPSQQERFQGGENPRMEAPGWAGGRGKGSGAVLERVGAARSPSPPGGGGTQSLG